MEFLKRPVPVFVKESSSSAFELEELRGLRGRVVAADGARLERDIKLAEAGLYGENAVAFELQNSHLPIHVLRDLRLEHAGLQAQIDFLVIGPYVNVVIECKNLIGDIEIDGRGNFTRLLDGRDGRREGLYSPITQGERHIQLMRALRDDMGTAVRIGNALFFDDIYKPVVVLANSKTVVYDQHAPKQVRKQLVRLDQLVAFIRGVNRKHGLTDSKLDGKERERLARWWLARHVERQRDLASRYRLIETQEQVPAAVLAEVPASAHAEALTGASASALAEAPICPECGRTMVLRKATRGPRAGKPFWGCPGYPACHGIINIDD